MEPFPWEPDSPAFYYFAFGRAKDDGKVAPARLMRYDVDSRESAVVADLGEIKEFSIGGARFLPESHDLVWFQASPSSVSTPDRISGATEESFLVRFSPQEKKVIGQFRVDVEESVYAFSPTEDVLYYGVKGEKPGVIATVDIASGKISTVTLPMDEIGMVRCAGDPGTLWLASDSDVYRYHIADGTLSHFVKPKEDTTLFFLGDYLIVDGSVYDSKKDPLLKSPVRSVSESAVWSCWRDNGGSELLDMDESIVTLVDLSTGVTLPLLYFPLGEKDVVFSGFDLSPDGKYLNFRLLPTLGRGDEGLQYAIIVLMNRETLKIEDVIVPFDKDTDEWNFLLSVKALLLRWQGVSDAHDILKLVLGLEDLDQECREALVATIDREEIVALKDVLTEEEIGRIEGRPNAAQVLEEIGKKGAVFVYDEFVKSGGYLFEEPDSVLPVFKNLVFEVDKTAAEDLYNKAGELRMLETIRSRYKGTTR
jgi:hypothetical protein